MWQDIENFLLGQPTPPQASPVSICRSAAIPVATTTVVKDEGRLQDEPLAEEFVDLDMLINSAVEQHSLQFVQQERAVKLEAETQSMQFDLEQERAAKLETEHTLQYTLQQDRTVKLEAEQDLVLQQDQEQVKYSLIVFITGTYNYTIVASVPNVYTITHIIANLLKHNELHLSLI